MSSYIQLMAMSASPLPVQPIILSLKTFLTIELCPPEWRRHNLYVIRDPQTVFYVGRSDVAFNRVWQHLQDGFKGRSKVGKFIKNNWPHSMNFTVELLHAGAELFNGVNNDPAAAEALLIAQLSPCFNDALNANPTPLPANYIPLNRVVAQPRFIKQMIREAGYAVLAEEKRAGWEQPQEDG